MNKLVHVEVVYASLVEQRLIAIEIEAGATIQAAILRSGLLTYFTEIDLSKQKVGVFGKQRALTEAVKEGDRIEIYRPLTLDPKEARRTKARVQKKNKR